MTGVCLIIMSRIIDVGINAENFSQKQNFSINTQVYNLITVDIKDFSLLKLRVQSYPKDIDLMPGW